MTQAEKINQIWTMLTSFSTRMKERMTLQKNLKKVPWTETSLWDLEASLEHQTDQLYDATSEGRDLWEVQYRAADVANVAMMIADQYTRMKSP